MLFAENNSKDNQTTREGNTTVSPPARRRVAALGAWGQSGRNSGVCSPCTGLLGAGGQPTDETTKASVFSIWAFSSGHWCSEKGGSAPETLAFMFLLHSSEKLGAT